MLRQICPLKSFIRSITEGVHRQLAVFMTKRALSLENIRQLVVFLKCLCLCLTVGKRFGRMSSSIPVLHGNSHEKCQVSKTAPVQTSLASYSSTYEATF